MRTFRKTMTMLMIAAFVLMSLPGMHAYATEQGNGNEDGNQQIVTCTTVPNVEQADHEQLYEAYLTSLFYETGASVLGETAQTRLNSQGQKLYDFLKENICRVAAGEEESTAFTVSGEQLLDWGGSAVYPAGDANAAFSAFRAEFEVDKVFDALLHDCPYELYWFDKVSGFAESASFGGGDGGYTISSATWSFSVVGDYQPDGYDPYNPSMDTAQTASAVAAAANAKALVAEHDSLSDYQKLKKYQEIICQLVSYDSASAESGNFSADADPWQLIYVFDGDTQTNVVCEGYSKAFQYLCDLSTFDCTVSCVTVTGYMSGGTGAGGHMWNIVCIGGKNYLVDVTNSDAGTIGQDGSLFLAGTSGSVSSGYVFGSTSFVYDPDCVQLWGSGEDSVLHLAADSYDPASGTHVGEASGGTAPSCTQSGLSAGVRCSLCGKSLQAQETIPALGHDLGQWELTEEATCAKPGQMVRRCSRCDYSETQNVGLKEHTYQSHVTAPTCAERGYTTHTCTLCGHSYQDTYKEATNIHTYQNDKDMTCEVCGYNRSVGVETVPMYRLYNPNSGEHFYTGSLEERSILEEAGWAYEGVAWNAPVKGEPVHRVYNPNSGDHHYTMSQDEVDMLVSVGWKYEGVAWNSAPKENVPQYRLWNPNADCGSHHYTSSEEERDWLVDLGWIYEGIGWYGMIK